MERALLDLKLLIDMDQVEEEDFPRNDVNMKSQSVVIKSGDSEYKMDSTMETKAKYKGETICIYNINN